MSHLAKFLNDQVSFVENAVINNLVNLAKKADKAYYNGDEPIMTDQQYDFLLEMIKKKDPENPYLNNTGASVDEKVKVSLPYFLGSMDKPSADEMNKFIKKFKKNNPPPYIITNKLDGVSGLLMINKDKDDKLYTRGNGRIGTDITNLLNIINIEYNDNKSYVIRGEIIMSKNNFEKYSNKKSNARNTVSGIVNSKTIDENEAKDTDYVAYEIVEPWMPFDEQIKVMKQLGLNTVYSEMVDDFDLDLLIEKYRSHIENSPYECDGIIISSNNPSKRTDSGNPSYSFAFKNLDDLETTNVKVKHVEWNISKDGYIKPVVVFEPVKLAGVNISRATAFNAKYIYDNSIGPNTILTIVRSGAVIPYIKHIVKSSKEPQMPSIDYEWNTTEVDIISLEYSVEQHAKELEKFCQDLNFENIALSIVNKFIDAGIDSMPKILKVSKKELYKVENFKKTMVDKIHNEIKENTEKMKMTDLMIASNIFGHGLGKKMITKIVTEYPDILFLYIEKTEEQFIELIKSIEGFAENRAIQFTSNIDAFLDLLCDLDEKLQDRLIFDFIDDENIIVCNEDLKGKKFVFSGFRNTEWEKMIEDRCGEILSSVSSKTYMVIAKQVDIDKGTNSKIKLAIEHGCRLVSKEKFLDELQKI